MQRLKLTRWTPRTSVLGAVLLLLLLADGAVWYSRRYPFGQRSLTLRQMYSSLTVFAGEHHGRFPTSEKGPYAALTMLYPEYCSPVELAGASGSVKKADSVLKKGATLDALSTSWVYTQGLQQDDDQKLAILWEAKAGIFENGQRNPSGGRAVLLLDGSVTNVPSATWQDFLTSQKVLQERTLRR